MVSAFLSALALAASASAYQVILPSASQGWNTSGPNVLTWQRVDTDPANFTAVLVNQVSYPPILSKNSRLIINFLPL
jgi:hypothetical protein